MQLLNRKEAAKMIGVNPATIDNLVKKGHLKKLKVADNIRTVRFDADEIKNLFKKTKS